jgi:ribosome biogenesis GTPase
LCAFFEEHSFNNRRDSLQRFLVDYIIITRSFHLTIPNNEQLQAFGWNSYWDHVLSQTLLPVRQLTPARVIAQFSHSYKIITPDGEHQADVTGRFEFNAVKRSDYPAVGDYVMVEKLTGESRSVIHEVLPRRSAMVRKAAGNVIEDQIIGSNLDYLFIVNSLNQDFNIRKIERYLIAAWESGASPVVLLTKADLCEQPSHFVTEVEKAAPGVPVHLVSAYLDQGKSELTPYLVPGTTIAVIGSSGVGKSTLLNWLAGNDRQRTQGIREDDARGRHTTTHRELFLLDSGALIMDTPGMRELQLWDAQEGWQQAFSDIEELAKQCRYRDCQHESDQGCAVLGALNSGDLDPMRLANYKKTAKELAHLARKENANAQNLHKKTNRAKPSKKNTRPRMNEFLHDLD